MQLAVVGRTRLGGSSLLPLLGWFIVGLADAVAVAIRVRDSTAWAGLAAVLYTIGQVLALGLVMTAAAAGWRLLERAGRGRWLGALGLGWLFTWAVLGSDLAGLRQLLPAWFALWLLTLLAALAGTGGAGLLLWASGRAGDRRWPWLLCLAAGVVLSVVNATNFPASYPGLHLLGVLVAGSLAQLAVPGLDGARQCDPRLRRVLYTAIATWAAISVLRAPSNTQLLLLLREPGAALAPYLAELRPALRSSHRIPEGQRPWFQDRSALPAVPPSAPPLVRAPVVVMLGIDSFRADLMADPRREADLPELFRLRRASTYFANARSPGSSTAPSLSAVFSGRYYSQLYWSLKEDAGPDVVPYQDPSARFPQLLTEAGVRTVNVDGVRFLMNDQGIVRGFAEEQTLRTGRPYAAGQDVMSAAIKQLEHASEQPLFLFLHLIDAHAPYNRAGKKDTPFAGYVAELGLVDRELGRLRKTLDRDELRDRAILIVLSDHGEAFGEHGNTFHGISVYDELLRVPLMIWSRYGQPRTISDPVSLVDLGPTVLDLMGVPTPGRFMGQSLVPYLRGQHPVLTRPIVAEARLKYALVTPEEMKIIYDTRAQTVELFDLKRDPREEHNLFGTAGDELLDVVRTFFQVHTLRLPGYRVPYRKW